MVAVAEQGNIPALTQSREKLQQGTGVLGKLRMIAGRGGNHTSLALPLTEPTHFAVNPAQL